MYIGIMKIWKSEKFQFSAGIVCFFFKNENSNCVQFDKQEKAS